MMRGAMVLRGCCLAAWMGCAGPALSAQPEAQPAAQPTAQPAAQPAAKPAAKPATDPAIGAEAPWPRNVKAGSTNLTVYQPQLDSWDGYALAARVAVQATSGDDPPRTSYGVATLSAKTLTDKGRRVVTVEQVKIEKAEFPAATEAQAKAWREAIAKAFAGKSRTIALDRLEAQLADSDASQRAPKASLRNEPPPILFSAVPALLVYVDGEPAYRPLPGTPYERVINTRPFLARNANGLHYLKVFDGWMTSTSLHGRWEVAASRPADMEQAYKKAATARSVDPLTGQSTPEQPAPSLKNLAPVIHVVTRPTELIVTDGPPNYTPIAQTQLLYVSNTTGRVFKHIADNMTYVLSSGRWFRSRSEDGPWEFVAANRLPEDFARIPDDSPVENVKASVAGTPQAREAAIAATLPQTAAVKIQDTQLTPPVFDGEPNLRPIEGTSLHYVANTATPMVQVSKEAFYAVENAVWFTAKSPRGPWAVATSVPAVIYSIPAGSPLHYVTYVRIYAVTADVVYVGYTPGYQGTMVDPETSVVVYGTGYAYDPWIGTVWYGPPCTYGFGATIAYTPWTGWTVAYGFGWAWGSATVIVGWGWGAYPWWGPWGWGWTWGPPYYPWYPSWGVAYGAGGGAVRWGPGGWAGYSGNIYQNWGNRATVSRVAGGYNAWTGNEWATQVGSSYNSRTGVSAAGQRGAVHNVYSGNYAAGARGVATGPGGDVLVGQHGTIGNSNTGESVSGSRGAYYNKDTGEWTTFGGATGQDGGRVARVGDDVYAGKDGNIYRRTDSGWEQHGDGGWQSVDPGARPEQGAGTGARPEQRANADVRPESPAHANVRPEPRADTANRALPNNDFRARQEGSARTGNLQRSTAGMGARGGARAGGGGRRR